MVLSGAAALAAFWPGRVLLVLRLWPLLLVGVFAMFSAIWSAEPAVSGRYGLQLLLTIGVGGILIVTCAPERLVRAVFIACGVILVLSILSGRQGSSASGPVLIGLLGSKNEMGTLCFVLLGAAATLGLSKDQPRPLRLMSAPVGALAAIYLIIGFSAGAVLAALIFFCVFCALLIASKLSGSAKFLLVVTIAVLAAPLWMVRSDLAQVWEHILVNVLHKDTGLTGRDYLWAHADALIAREPLLGHGYRSTWLGHGVDTIGLLRWAGLQSGEGFSFHNSYREWLVDFGFFGTALILVALGFGLARLLVHAARPGVAASTLFFASIGVVFAVRGYFEYIFGPFSASTVMVIIAAGLGYHGWRASPQVRSASMSTPGRVELKIASADQAGDHAPV
nr:O-antigen ligase family protein [uncultured Brevundimonas sp.]